MRKYVVGQSMTLITMAPRGLKALGHDSIYMLLFLVQ